MATQPPTNTIQVTSTAPLSALATDFNKWAEGRSGFTVDELVNLYALLVQLNPQRTQALKDEIKALPTPKQPTPTPQPTPKPEPKKPEAPAAKQAAPAAPTPAPAPEKPAVPPATIIQRTKFPKWWNDEGTAKISLTSPGSQFIVTAKSDYQLYISTIALTVSGACTIVFSFGQYGSSGAMRFGDTDEPRGIVIAMGNSPAPCGSGSFMITGASGSAVDVGGFVSYFLWKKETERLA